MRKITCFLFFSLCTFIGGIGAEDALTGHMRAGGGYIVMFTSMQK